MNLKKKFTLLTFVTTLTIIIMLIIVLSRIFMSSILELEEQSARKNVDRAINRIDEEVKNLDMTTRDYAAWDETYKYATGSYFEYPSEQVSDDILEGLGMNVIIIVDKNHNVIYSRDFSISYGLQNITPDSDLPTDQYSNNLDGSYVFWQYYADNHPELFYHDSESSKTSGLLLISEKIFLVSSRPIIHTDKQGPVVGSLVMMRLLDEEKIASISEQLNLNIMIQQYDYYNDIETKNNIESKDTIITDKIVSTGNLEPIDRYLREDISILAISSALLEGKFIQKDIYDNRNILLTVLISRDIYTLGRESLAYIIIALVLVSILFGILNIIVLDRFFFKRIESLDKSISLLGTNDDMSLRVSIEGRTRGGDDEISKFVDSLNRTLAAIEQMDKEKKAIFKALSDTYLHVDSKGNIIDFKLGNDVHNCKLASLKAKDNLEKVLGKESEKMLYSLQKSFEQFSIEEIECDRTQESGHEIFKIRIVPIKEDEAIIILRHITQERQREENIKKQNEELEISRKAALNIMEDLTEANKHLTELDKAKTDFLNIASHELKTPLTAISAYIEILEDYSSQMNQQQIHSIAAIKRNSDQLKILINNILEISRIESGKFELNYSNLDVKSKIHSIVENLRILCWNKGVSLNYYCNEDFKMLTDEMRFEEIFNNLIGNSIKFTDTGSINVTAELTKGNDIGFAVFSVSDTGVGIPESKLKGLFSTFYQADSSISRKYGGSGLGLAITKKIIELQGGNINVTSFEGKGTTFTLRLPLFPKFKGIEEHQMPPNA
jgi:signal transduction histidine kinase/sensor domain CHASE-containing protein